MTQYPSLKRWLAAGLTLILIGIPLAYVMSRGDRPNSIDLNPLSAKEKKENGDWIMYGGDASRNMVNKIAKGLPVTWDVDKRVNIKWIADLGSKAYGGPIIADGRVFVGTNNENPRDKSKKLMKFNEKSGKDEPIDHGVVMAFDEMTGKFLWQALFPKLPGGQVVDWPREGVCSTPHIEGDKMYYVSNSCKVICADVKTGKTLWELNMIDELGVFPHNISDCSPLLVGDHLWVVTSNGVNENHINVPAPKAPSFIKVDKTNGKVLWQDNSPSAALLTAAKGDEGLFKTLVNRGELIQHGQWANAAYGVVKGQPQVIFPGGDGWIYAFDPQGKLIWKFDCNPKDAKYELKRGERSDFIATPVIYKDRVYIGTGQDPEHKFGIGHLWCIDMTKKGDVSPELVTDNTDFPPKTKKNPNSAEIWHYGGVINDKALVKKLGRNYYFGRTMSTCAIVDDILYVSELLGILHCMDANTGKVHWEHNTGNENWSSPYYADGKVYQGNDDGVVFVFEHGTKLKLLAENNMGSAVRATPVAANGVLYVMTENKLFAIKK
jgi:outer membrane protein assembly factor BamB